ncbi:MAG: hypothetical protein WC325_11645 [Candidatus Bathyarchaeia archaeon]
MANRGKDGKKWACKYGCGTTNEDVMMIIDHEKICSKRLSIGVS